jgi:hypothetical protein
MADEQSNASSGLHIDADWKKQAQEEKKRLAEEAERQKQQAAQQAAAGGGGAAAASAATEAAQAGQPASRGELPPANFTTLVSQTVTQAMFAMGMIPDPQTGRRVAMLDMARFHIDILAVLQEKTQGNLTEEEQRLLSSSLYELRMQYVQLSQQAIREQTGADEQGQPGGGQGGGGIIGG